MIALQRLRFHLLVSMLDHRLHRVSRFRTGDVLYLIEEPSLAASFPRNHPMTAKTTRSVGARENAE